MVWKEEMDSLLRQFACCDLFGGAEWVQPSTLGRLSSGKTLNGTVVCSWHFLQSRMAESVSLFDSICNSQWFANSLMVWFLSIPFPYWCLVALQILFLNKMDLLADKIASKPLKSYIKDYDRPEGYKVACVHFHKLFVTLNQLPNTPLYTHFMCATEMKQIKHMWWLGLVRSLGT